MLDLISGTLIRFCIVLLLSTRLVLLDHAALRIADELNQVVALRALWELCLGLIATCLVVELALEQDAAGVVDSLNLLGCEATA